MHKVLKSVFSVCLLLLAGVSELSAQYDKDVFYMRGRIALSEGKYASAIENFNILSQLDTADHWTFFSGALPNTISATSEVQRMILTVPSG